MDTREISFLSSWWKVNSQLPVFETEKSEFVWKPNKSENRNRKVNIKENIDGVIG